MNGSVNKVILIGNLGKDPDVRRLENGAVVASFPLATSEIYTDKQTGEKKENTDWHDIVLWRGLAEAPTARNHRPGRHSRRPLDLARLTLAAWPGPSRTCAVPRRHRASTPLAAPHA